MSSPLDTQDDAADQVPASICRVHCDFCNVMLAVHVPSSLIALPSVTVRCGQCTALLSVDMQSVPDYGPDAKSFAVYNCSQQKCMIDQMLYTSQPFKFFHTLILNEVQETVDPLFAYGSGMQKHECNATMVFSPSKLRGSVNTMSGTVSTTSSASAMSSCAPMESKTTQKRTITTDDKQIKAENSGKKTRHPSAYNIFMREEMQRIKAARPLLSHRQAFGAASKSWATCPRISGLDLAGDQEADCTNQF